MTLTKEDLEAIAKIFEKGMGSFQKDIEDLKAKVKELSEGAKKGVDKLIPEVKEEIKVLKGKFEESIKKLKTKFE